MKSKLLENDHWYISDLWLKYLESTISGLLKIDDNMWCKFKEAMLYCFLPEQSKKSFIFRQGAGNLQGVIGFNIKSTPSKIFYGNGYFERPSWKK
jgi:hypothetical protein